MSEACFDFDALQDAVVDLVEDGNRDRDGDEDGDVKETTLTQPIGLEDSFQSRKMFRDVFRHTFPMVCCRFPTCPMFETSHKCFQAPVSSITEGLVRLNGEVQIKMPCALFLDKSHFSRDLDGSKVKSFGRR